MNLCAIAAAAALHTLPALVVMLARADGWESCGSVEGKRRGGEEEGGMESVEGRQDGRVAPSLPVHRSARKVGEEDVGVVCALGRRRLGIARCVCRVARRRRWRRVVGSFVEEP